jgi:hypothetical protein
MDSVPNCDSYINIPSSQTCRGTDKPIERSWVLNKRQDDGDRLCGLVVRVLGYRPGGPGSITITTRKKVVGLERGPLSLVSATEELLDRKVAATV